METTSTSTLPDGDHSVYTSHYCEENVYLLIKRLLTPGRQWDLFSVFISNPTRTVALWNQRTASCKDTPIVWDYHVVLALRERRQGPQGPNQLWGTWIYDLDSWLPVPSHWSAYVDQTFPLGASISSQYQSLFRVVPGEVYLNNFASDRSHMVHVCRTLSEEPRYLAEPPGYPVICGPEAEKHGVRHNLMTHFVSMSGNEGFGTVMDLNAFTMWCGTQ